MAIMTKPPQNDQGKQDVLPAQVDGKGRLTIPSELRRELGVKAGDTVFVRIVDGDLVIRKAINPFDALVEQALREYTEGKTQDLRSFAKDSGIDLDE